MRRRDFLKASSILPVAAAAGVGLGANAPAEPRPAPGGPGEIYERFEEENGITRGPEGIYMRPSDRPGFGRDLITE